MPFLKNIWDLRAHKKVNKEIKRKQMKNDDTRREIIEGHPSSSEAEQWIENPLVGGSIPSSGICL